MKTINILEQKLEKEIKNKKLYNVKTVHKYNDYDDFLEENIENSKTVYKVKIGQVEKELFSDINTLLKIYDKLSIIYRTNQEYKKLEEIYLKILNIALIKDDTISIATSYHNLAEMYESIKEYDKSEYNYKKAITIREQYLGIEHYDTATSYNNLAITYTGMAKYQEAFQYMQKAIDVWEKILPRTNEALLNAKKALLFLDRIKNKDLKYYPWKKNKHKKMYETFFKHRNYKDYFSWVEEQHFFNNCNWDINFLDDKLTNDHFFMEENTGTERCFFYQLLFRAFHLDIETKKEIYDQVQNFSIDIKGSLHIYAIMSVLEEDIEEAKKMSTDEIQILWAIRENEIVSLIELILNDEK